MTTVDTSDPLRPKTTPTPILGPNGEGANILAYEAAFDAVATKISTLNAQAKILVDLSTILPAGTLGYYNSRLYYSNGTVWCRAGASYTGTFF